ncbi:MAG: YifB family Mg chelatase-like AAA ATPase [Pseudomonadota bacterium]
MPLAQTLSRAPVGLEAPMVTIEVHLAPGLPRFSVVGMAETSVREARDRVRAAIVQAGFSFPQHAITVHLGPADLPKHGGRYDLAIAIGILIASGQLPPDAAANVELYGELSLSGEVKPVPALLTAGLRAQAMGCSVIVPAANGAELAQVPTLAVFAIGSLQAVAAHLNGLTPQPRCQPTNGCSEHREPMPDLADVRGHDSARRALEIVAAGGHHLLLVGPPGSGKSMLARRLPSLLPPLSLDEALEAAAIASLVGAAASSAVPFRAPHHTASAAALVGGGRDPRPGEITRAHRGVLFLDEVAEFPRSVLDALREPLELGRIVISRAQRQTEFPARFQFVAAMNPCPCGYCGDPDVACRCTPDQTSRYQQRLSGPLLDRIDVRLTVPRLDFNTLSTTRPGEPSCVVAARVAVARQRQLDRAGTLNARLERVLEQPECQLDGDGEALLARAASQYHLSARAIERTLRIARTITDLAARSTIAPAAVAEALQLRGTVGNI